MLNMNTIVNAGFNADIPLNSALNQFQCRISMPDCIKSGIEVADDSSDENRCITRQNNRQNTLRMSKSKRVKL
jgi:hypothetical protein